MKSSIVQALQTFEIMKQRGLHRNTILYATLIKVSTSCLQRKKQDCPVLGRASRRQRIHLRQ